MPLYAPKDAPREFPKSGLHQAVCAFVEDLGVQKGEYKGKPKLQRKIVIIWELDEKMADGRPFLFSKKYTLSMYQSNLRTLLESWRGQGFTEDQAHEFDIEKLIRANCMLNLIRKPKQQGGGEYMDLAGVMPLEKERPKMPVTITEIPKWIEEERSKQVLDNAPSLATAGGPPQAEDDLPF